MNQRVAVPAALRGASSVGVSSLESAASLEEAPTISQPKLTVAGMFAGIGGLEEGFRQAGHSSNLLCEIDPFARSVLARHFPDAEIATDITALKSLPECDVLTAGFPCQDLSQVGRRRGITGPNSGLIETVFELLRGAKRQPRWLVLENVPFMLNLHQGAAIRAIAEALEGMGFAWAYRTIDARAFGLPQRRRRVVLLASPTQDPRPVLFSGNETPPPLRPRELHACGFYWTEGNTGLGWAVDAIPPLKGGSALHIPSPPGIWFPSAREIVTPAIEDAERLQGFAAGWTNLDDVDEKAWRKRWRMVGNAVSVPMAKWIASRLTENVDKFDAGSVTGLPTDKSWPAAAWGHEGRRSATAISEWPVVVEAPHLSDFLQHRSKTLSIKATRGFHSRLIKSGLRYEEAFARDLAHQIEHAEAN